MRTDVPTLADVYRTAGYRTGLFGKWHNGSQPPYHPNFRGFDTFYGFASGHWAHYFNPELERNGEWVRGSGYLPDDLTDKTMEFMHAAGDQPFLAVLSFNTPHSPMQVPDTYWQRMANRDLRMRHRDPDKEDPQFTRAALAMVENIDWNVGRLMDHLETSGKARNTLVVYLSDNGPNSYRWNGGMKGRKGATDEGGVRSPFLIRWPGKIPAGKRIDYLAGSIDLLPTLAGLTRTVLHDSIAPEGEDISEILTGTASGERTGVLYQHWGNRTSLRTQHYRVDAEGALFDMRSDPGQATDLSDTLPAVRDSLDALRLAWHRQLARPVGRPFTVGYPGAGATALPSRDAELTPPVERSNRYPNATYLSGWSAGSGMASWPITVYREGDYGITLYFAGGATGPEGLVVWTSRDSLIGTLPPGIPIRPYGAQEDRVPRIESYAMDFEPWYLGTLHLKNGTDTLRLRFDLPPPVSGLAVQRLVLHHPE